MTLHLAARHASWVGLAAVAPATWWWVGLLVGDSGTDAIIRPVDISNGTAAAIGATSTAIVLASLVVVLRGRRLHLVPGAPVMALATCAAAAGYVGLAYRAATTRVDGANIGGALLLYAGAAVVPGLLAVAFFSTVRNSRQR